MNIVDVLSPRAVTGDKQYDEELFQVAHTNIERANFSVHGKAYQFAPVSLGFLDESSWLRQRVVWLVKWWVFDRVILAFIVLNSVSLAMIDYSVNAVNPETWEPETANSWRNEMVLTAETVFTVIFTVEFVLKVVAMGFIQHSGTYLRDGWNLVDFIVVVSGIMILIPGMPNVSALRTFRVMRPLRSLRILPGMKLLVSSLLASIPSLFNVVALLSFIFFVFGILGLQLWPGALHGRCRLTEFPVAIVNEELLAEYVPLMAEQRLPEHERSAEAVAYFEQVAYNRSAYPFCGVNTLGEPFPLDDPSWTSENSAWFTPRQCAWPVDESVERVCSLPSWSGSFTCPAPLVCGSNYDRFGNRRFADDEVQADALHRAAFNFGITNFDWMGRAFLTIFQCITMEGWVDIMYMVQDATGEVVPAVYFIVLILVGSFFLLNLTLAVIWDNFSVQQSLEAELLKAAEAEEVLLEEILGDYLSVSRSSSSDSDEEGDGDVNDEELEPARPTQDTDESARRDSSERHPAEGAREEKPSVAAPTRRASKQRSGTTRTKRRRSTANAVKWASIVTKLLARHADDSDGVGSGEYSPRNSRSSSIWSRFSDGGVSPAAAHASSRSSRRASAPVAPGSALSPGDATPLSRSLRAAEPQAGSLLAGVAKQRRKHEVRAEQWKAMFKAVSGDGSDTDLLTGAGRVGDQDGDDMKKQVSQAVLRGRLRKPSHPHLRRLASTPGGRGRGKRRAHRSSLRRTNTDLEASPIAGLFASPQQRRAMLRAAAALAVDQKRRAEEAAAAEQGACASFCRPFHDQYDAVSTHPTVRSTRLWLIQLVDGTSFNIFIMVVILTNTVLLAMDRHPMDDGLAYDLEIGNFVLSTVFAIEMLLKLLAMGPVKYVQDRFNVFDAFIVTMWVFETLVAPPAFLSGAASSDSGGGLAALRAFRLFRVFKLAKSWVSLRTLIGIVIQTLSDVGNFVVLLLLFMYIFVLIGMQFFANRFHFDALSEQVVNAVDRPAYDAAEIPRSNFDGVMISFVSIFQILTAEDWNVIAYDGWRTYGVFSVTYFVPLVVIGNFIVLNLFLAILLGNFEGLDDETEASEDTGLASTQVPPSPGAKRKSGIMSNFKFAVVRRAKGFRRLVEHFRGSAPPGDSVEGEGADAQPAAAEREPGIDRETRPEALAISTDSTTGDQSGGMPQTPKPVALETPRSTRHRKESLMQLAAVGKLNESKAGGDADAIDVRDVVSRPSMRVRASKSLRGVAKTLFSLRKDLALPQHRAFFCVPADNIVRRACGQVVHHPMFDSTVLVLILISSAVLAVDSPLLDPDSPGAMALGEIDTVLTYLFAAEAVLKIVAFGLVLHKDAYLRNSWNILDFLIVVVSILSRLGDGNESLKALRTLRTLRALRPLRVISRNEGMKLVVNALLRAVPSIINVMFVCLLFFIIFGVVGVNYFKGGFSHCTGSVFESLSPEQVELVVDPLQPEELSTEQLAWGASGHSAPYTAPTSRSVCLWLGADWEPTLPQSFDNIFAAAGTLFEMSTTEKWVEIMFAGVDARGPDMQPVRNNSEAWMAFFVAFMIVGSFFMMNLFVGVVIDNFNRMKEEMGDNVLLTDAQKEWVRAQEIMLHVKPQKRRVTPSGAAAQAAFWLIHTSEFESFIMVCIMFNTLIMSIAFFGMSTEFSQFLEWANTLFAFIFNVEMLVKMYALRMSYFRDTWNRFDFLIVVGTDVGLIASAFSSADIGGIASIVRTFRVGRVFRLVQSAKTLRALFNTLMITLPSLANIGSLLFLLYFIYAIMGVQLFARVKLRDSLNEHANFQSFSKALVTLIRSSTGESWNSIMYELADTADCSEDTEWNDQPQNGCGFPVAAVVFYYSFTLLVTFVMLNVFIAVILEGFGDMNDQEKSTLSPSELKDFTAVWAEFDPTARMLVPAAKLLPMFRKLRRPMGFSQEIPDEDVRRFIASVDINTYRGNLVHFVDVALAAAKRAVSHALELRGQELEEVGEDHTVVKKFAKLKDGLADFVSVYGTQHQVAAEVLRDTFRTVRFRRAIDHIDQTILARPRIRHSPSDPARRSQDRTLGRRGTAGVMMSPGDNRQVSVTPGSFALSVGADGVVEEPHSAQDSSSEDDSRDAASPLPARGAAVPSSMGKRRKTMY